ncbi:MAG: adenosylcobinamide-phosphate synthase CbiB [Tissierellia bacterium]|nr:adenosylcobinamide-phosphate synthase CbiB [Tissierellia bacterium]
MSLIIGYILDLIIGDPQGYPHPIRLIGKLIEHVEKFLRTRCRNWEDEIKAGALLWFTVVSLSFMIPLFILHAAARINIIIYIIIESIMCYYILAVKSLKDESMKVYHSLKNNDIIAAKHHLSFIVGRDVEDLNSSRIIKAAVETVAENTADGVIAPMIFIMIGGAPLGFLYKAVNTLDSMVGYKNEKYINIGKFSAIADDLFNFIPSRIAVFFMIISSYILKMDYVNAYKIYKRDRSNHKSPNSAQTESVCAGALNLMLGGNSYYDEILVEKPAIGDNNKEAEAEDIKRANKLMYVTSMLCLIVGIALKYCFSCI